MTEKSSVSIFDENYKLILDNINEAAVSVGKRAEDIILLAATKTVDIDTINHAIKSGINYIGENRVQELLSKDQGYAPVHKHFIGHLQSNKVKDILPRVEVSEFERIHIKGLMAIPPICDSELQNRKYFEQMHKLFVDIRDKKIDNSSMDILSMGMSDDYATAIREGANLVRIGTALFGRRNYTI